VRGRITVVLVVAASLGVLAAPTQAAETIGEVSDPAGLISCSGDTSYAQMETVTLPRYNPSAAGVITSFSSYSDGTVGQTLRFMVVEPDPAAPRVLTTRQLDQVRTLTVPNAVNTFTGLHLPITPAQHIGFFMPTDSAFLCQADAPAGNNGYFHSNPVPPPIGTSGNYAGTDTSRRLNISATVEPDRDGDRFGDETQDGCPQLAAKQGRCCKKGFRLKTVKKKGKPKRKKCVRKKRKKK
jgi:hypothetical protein